MDSVSYEGYYLLHLRSTKFASIGRRWRKETNRGSRQERKPERIYIGLEREGKKGWKKRSNKKFQINFNKYGNF